MKIRISDLCDHSDNTCPDECPGKPEPVKEVIIPWYKRGYAGYPIETVPGRPVSNFIRIVVQNIRKIFVSLGF